MLLWYNFGISCVHQHNHLASCLNINQISTSQHTKIVSPVCQVQQRRYDYNWVCCISVLGVILEQPSGKMALGDMMSCFRCVYYDLHKELVPYKEAWDWQRSVLEWRKELVKKDEDFKDMVMVLQHKPVYTLGTGSSEDFLKFDLNDAPYNLYRTERGGEVTYHGPGQLVMYPIMNLRYHKMDLHWYLRALEEVIIRVLSSAFSINASRLEGFTGVWVGDQKVAAIGVRVSKWISFHGLALNVATDLSPFKQIVPCGIMDRQVGSIKTLLAEQSSAKYTDSQLIDLAHNALIKEFSEVFLIELQQSHKSSQDLFTT